MDHRLLEAARRLSDAALGAQVLDLAARGRRATAELVAHLGEMQSRGLELAAGYASLFEYCLEALHLSEGEAYHRMVVARLARQFPVVLDLLASGEVNLTTVRQLAKHLTPENHVQVLQAARYKRKPDVERLVASLAPRPDAATLTRREPSRAAAPPPPAQRMVVGNGTHPHEPDAPMRADNVRDVPPPAAAPQPPQPTPARVTPLAPERFRYQTTIGPDVVERMQLARDLLGHARDDEDALLRRAFDALLHELVRRKFAVTDRPGPDRGTAPDSRHVPAAVRRAVSMRDLGRCAFTAGDGRRCSERGWLEFHHVKPYAAGGEATVGNVQLRCRRHNQHEARVFFARPVGDAGISAGAAGGWDGVAEAGG